MSLKEVEIKKTLKIFHKRFHAKVENSVCCWQRIHTKASTAAPAVCGDEETVMFLK